MKSTIRDLSVSRFASLAGGLLAVGVLLLAQVGATPACPFCSAVQQTLSEEIKNADAALIVQLAKTPNRPANPELAANPVKASFSVVEVLKGAELLGNKREIEILFFGQQPVGTVFFVTGVDPKDIAWSTPTALSDRARTYITHIVKLPETGPKRLVFFQDYFEDADALLAGDAYDEFAKAPYADIQALKDQMQRDKLIGWINDPVATSTSRRRLYLTMLGVCGQGDDIPKLEAMIRNEDRAIRTSLDALIACYLNLRGPEGVPLVVDLFLKNTKAEYVDTYATIMALRFHGQEATVISKDVLLAALRTMLDRPQLADLVIPDLARWEDWSAIDRLGDLFKNATADSMWVRVPVINYLRACPRPEAKQKIEELSKIDPDAVKRANQFFPFASSSKPSTGSARPEDQKKDKSKSTDSNATPSNASPSTVPDAKPSLAPSATSNKLSALRVPLSAATMALGGEVLTADAVVGALPIEGEIEPVVAVSERAEANETPVANAAPRTAAAVVPQPLSKIAVRSNGEFDLDRPASNRWLLLTYAGVSALGLATFMYSLLSTTAPGTRRPDSNSRGS